MPVLQGVGLSPSIDPLLPKLSEMILSSNFAVMKEHLTDNIALLQKMELQY